MEEPVPGSAGMPGPDKCWCFEPTTEWMVWLLLRRLGTRIVCPSPLLEHLADSRPSCVQSPQKDPQHLATARIRVRHETLRSSCGLRMRILLCEAGSPCGRAVWFSSLWLSLYLVSCVLLRALMFRKNGRTTYQTY